MNRKGAKGAKVFFVLGDVLKHSNNFSGMLNAKHFLKNGTGHQSSPWGLGATLSASTPHVDPTR